MELKKEKLKWMRTSYLQGRIGSVNRSTRLQQICESWAIGKGKEQWKSIENHGTKEDLKSSEKVKKREKPTFENSMIVAIQWQVKTSRNYLGVHSKKKKQNPPGDVAQKVSTNVLSDNTDERNRRDFFCLKSACLREPHQSHNFLAVVSSSIVPFLFGSVCAVNKYGNLKPER